MPKNSKTTTADAVYEWLGTNPGFHTLDDLTAALPDIKQQTLTRALTALVNGDQIRTRHDNDVQTWTADAPAPADNSDSDSEVTDDTEHDHANEVAEQSQAEAIPAGPNLQVIGIAFVLSRTTAGLTADAIAAGAGLGVEAVWPVLAAMHAAGAATCDREFILDPAAVWSSGTADPATVSLSAAPDTVQCPMCGNPAPVPGRKATRKRGNGGGSRSTGQYEPVRDMGAQVEAWLKRHPDQDVTPGQISKALKEATGHPNPNAYSSGAIRNVLFKLAKEDQLRQLPDAPQLTFHTPTANPGR